MKWLLCLICLCFWLPGSAQAKVCQSLTELDWLLGHWLQQGGKSRTLESWRQVSDETFEGGSVTLSNESQAQIAKESTRLVQMLDGIFYLAKVNHNAMPIPFKLASCQQQSATFSNPNHDFPTQLRYHLTSEKTLRVEVSGPDGKGFVVEYQRLGGEDLTEFKAKIQSN